MAIVLCALLMLQRIHPIRMSTQVTCCAVELAPASFWSPGSELLRAGGALLAIPVAVTAAVVIERVRGQVELSKGGTVSFDTAPLQTTVPRVQRGSTSFCQ